MQFLPSKATDCLHRRSLCLIIVLVDDLLPILVKKLLATDVCVWLQMERFTRDVVDFEHQSNQAVIGHFDVKAQGSV